MLGLLVDGRRAGTRTAIAEHRPLELVERIDHARHGLRRHAHRADGDVHGFDAELFSARSNRIEGRLIRRFEIRAVADDGLEAERLDLVEILDGDLAGDRRQLSAGA